MAVVCTRIEMTVLLKYMIYRFCTNASFVFRRLSLLLLIAGAGMSGRAQLTYLVDSFDPSGVGGNSYTGGQIGNVWVNWFGSAFSSLAWDSTSDAASNSASGSLKITANFNTSNNTQFEVYDGFSGIMPGLNGLQYTNFQCDVRFASGSATANNTFGHLQFGIAVGNSQDYFGAVDVPASNTNWVHVSLPLNAVADPNLQNINDVLIHIYGPSTSPALSGASTLWVDNIQFIGATPVPTNCVVNWNDVHQRIDGFGASSAWRSSWTTNLADLLFSTNNGVAYTDNLGHASTNNGIGLSLLRTRIAPAGSAVPTAIPTSVETNIMQLAQARGARVWSTPWTPASGFKSSHVADGGNYLGSGANPTNLAYAQQLANYVSSMKTSGINLYAISIQNEPDGNHPDPGGYESCVWTNTQIHDFATNLYSAMLAQNVTSTLIMLPESQNWQDPQNLASKAMSDPAVAADVGILANHNYDGVNGPAPLTKSSSGKALWETEVSLLSGSDSTITNGVYYAQRIFQFMTVAQANAWHYWWLISGNSTGNQGLLDNNAAVTERLFTVGNYSRFVRPGYYRIGVSNNAFTSISAYKDMVSSNFAIVAVNPTFTTLTQIFNLANFPSVSSVTPWITSGNLSLASQTPVSVTSSSFTYAMPALSVVTFVGQVSTPNTAPAFLPVSDQVINAGYPLQVTNFATDPDLPSQTLAFNLPRGPANATLTTVNGTNAVFAWRPLVSQAGTTNPVSVVVTDNGSPNLSATNNFTVTVNPLTNPVVGSVTVLGGQVNLTVSGPQGPNYTLLTTTNLTGGWQTLYTIGSTNSPVTLMIDTNGTDPTRYYRLELGP